MSQKIPLQKIPVDTLYHVTVVAKDARALARNHAEFYGIDRWRVYRLTPDRLRDSTFRGRHRGKLVDLGLVGDTTAPGEYGFLCAVGSSENGGVTFEIVQPTTGLSTFEHFLATRGQGVHGLCVAEVAPVEFTSLRSWLATEGIGIAQSFSIDGVVESYYLDTRKALGGFYLQVNVPKSAAWREQMKVDEEWDFSNEITRSPAGAAPTKTQGIPHFGVVVEDTEEKVERFSYLFGQARWRGMHWRTAPGSLEDTTYNGKPVVHSYFTGRADIGKTPLGVPFGFEIVQPTFGPSHYKEDFLQPLGPGIHHIDLTFPVKDWPEWEALNDWLANRFAAPTCMSGWLRNKAALFQYQDTREKLGYVVEIHAPKPPDQPKKMWAPDYWYDFSDSAGG
jgi:hypothetical protein